MAKKYSESLIQQAKVLFERRITAPKIAKQLSIQRTNTIYEWVKKFGWKKISDYKDFKEQEMIWKDIARNALEYLKGKGFTSMKDAMNVFERATTHLESLEKEKTDPESELLKIMGDGEDKDEFEEDESEKTESEKIIADNENQ